MKTAEIRGCQPRAARGGGPRLLLFPGPLADLDLPRQRGRNLDSPTALHPAMGHHSPWGGGGLGPLGLLQRKHTNGPKREGRNVSPIAPGDSGGTGVGAETPKRRQPPLYRKEEEEAALHSQIPFTLALRPQAS